MRSRRFSRQIVLLAYKLVVIQHVEFLAGGQLLPADEAREAVEMEDLLPRLADQVWGRDAVPAAAALRPVPPESKEVEVKIGGIKKRLGVDARNKDAKKRCLWWVEMVFMFLLC